MRRAFTLIELMISVVLLSIIVTFLYESVAQLQNSNQQLIKNTDKTVERETLLKVLYNDFINLSALKIEDKSEKTDVLVLQTSNSFYAMSRPYVRYAVGKDGVLRRIESISDKLDFENNFFRFDSIAKDVQMLKVYENKGHYFIYVKSANMEDIYLDMVPPAFGATKENTENNNTENNTENTENEEGEEAL
jgi:prepilin-type N-terminal cleavage/methylation domain-containing protein